MLTELRAYLDKIDINSDNIGAIRARLKMPFRCEWNAWVLEETALRENWSRNRAAVVHLRALVNELQTVIDQCALALRPFATWDSGGDANADIGKAKEALAACERALAKDSSYQL